MPWTLISFKLMEIVVFLLLDHCLHRGSFLFLWLSRMEGQLRQEREELRSEASQEDKVDI